MAKRGQGGVIINVSSGGASRAHRHMFGYDTSKGGIEAATRSMALDLAPLNIRVNTVVPGSTRVDHGTFVGDTPIPPSEVIPLTRQGTPDDIAAAVAFLASDDALISPAHALSSMVAWTLSCARPRSISATITATTPKA